MGKGFPRLSVREEVAADKASVLYKFTDILVFSRIGVVAVAVVDAYLAGFSAQRVRHGVQTRGEPVERVLRTCIDPEAHDTHARA